MATGVPFGRYVIKRRLGTGGMGEVFLADQLGPLGPVRPVALKRMLPRFARDPDTVRMFLEEMSIAALLNHPNVATTYDFGEVDGVYFLALEHVDGLPTNELVASLGPLPIPEAIAIVRATLDALQYAHGLRAPDGEPRPVVHSDVSPHNVMISTEGAVKLLDFGLARTEARALGGPVRGKLGYVAPEQAQGAAPDRRFDLYALGVVLYELVSGVRPIDEQDVDRAIEMKLAKSWRPLRELRPDAAPLAALVERALEPDPERRFQTAEELSAAIESAALRFGRAGKEHLAQLVVRAGGPGHRADPSPELTGTGMAIEAVRAELAPPKVEILEEDTDETLVKDTLPPPVRRAPAPGPARSAGSHRVGWAVALFLTTLAGGGAGFVTKRFLADRAAETMIVDARPAEPARTTTIAPAIEPPRVITRAEPTPETERAAQEEPPPEREAAKPLPREDSAATTRTSPAHADRARSRSKAAPASRESTAPRTDKRTRDKEEGSASGFGVLSVRSTPWSRVSLDGKVLGDGVVASRPVPAGSHVLVLSPGDDNYPARSVVLEIKPGISTKVFVDFITGTVRIDPP